MKDLFQLVEKRRNRVAGYEKRLIEEEERTASLLAARANVSAALWEMCWTRISSEDPEGDRSVIPFVGPLRCPIARSPGDCYVDPHELASRICRAARLLYEHDPDRVHELRPYTNGDFPKLACELFRRAAEGADAKEIVAVLSRAIEAQDPTPRDIFDAFLAPEGGNMSGFMGQLRRIASAFTDSWQSERRSPFSAVASDQREAIFDRLRGAFEERGRSPAQVQKILGVARCVLAEDRPRIPLVTISKCGMPRGTVANILRKLKISPIESTTGKPTERHLIEAEDFVRVLEAWKPRVTSSSPHRLPPDAHAETTS